jgi:hypothetical protein
MRERLDRMRGITRLHGPSTDEPLIMLIIDEIAALTGWINDRTTKRRIESALGLLLSQDAQQVWSSSARSRTRGKTCCRNATCSPPGSRSG